MLNHLENLGFVKINRNTNYPNHSENNDSSNNGDAVAPIPGLTQEGLQFAHQIKTERQREYTNILLVWLTTILVVLTVVLVI